MASVVLARGRHCPDFVQVECMKDVDIVRVFCTSSSCFISLVRLPINSGPTVLGVAKSYKKSKLSEDEAKQVELEIKLHQQLSSANSSHVVPFWLACEDSTQLHIITAYSSEGDLRSRLEQQRFTEAAVREQIVQPLLDVLHTMHTLGFVHRDIKPENVFVSGSQVMLGDYGLAIALPQAPEAAYDAAAPALFSPRARASSGGGARGPGALRAVASSSCISDMASVSNESSSTGQVMKRSSSYAGTSVFDCSVLPQLPQLQAGGTPAYTAPEVVLAAFNNTPVADVVGPQNDVWALGVLTLECLTGQHPFGDPGMSAGAFMCSIISDRPLQLQQLPVSAACRDWLSLALCKDPKQRATAEQLQQHVWLTGKHTAVEQEDFHLQQQQQRQGSQQQLQQHLSCPESLMHGCTSVDVDWCSRPASLTCREADALLAWQSRSFTRNGRAGPGVASAHSLNGDIAYAGIGRLQDQQQQQQQCGHCVADAAVCVDDCAGSLNRLGLGQAAAAVCGQQHRTASPYCIPGFTSWED